MALREPNYLKWDDRLTEADQPRLAAINASLERLNELRAVEMNVSGPFARSKIAWKLVTYQHALLHRIVALVDGAAVTWNAKSTLSTMLAARAFMETMAVIAEVENRVSRFLAEENLGGLDAVAQQGIFASRDADWISEFPETKAVSVLTYIDKFDKRVPGFRGHYDILSERCHPNSLGHNFMFSKLDTSEGSVRYFDEREPGRNAQMILAALGPLPLIESMSARLDELILKVSDLQHRIAPVGGALAAGDKPDAGVPRRG
jgi:hypothetical protein